MPRKFCIWIVTRPGHSHSRCFEEVALSLSDAFAALGYEAPIVTDAAQVRGTAIALGAHMLEDMEAPGDLIVYNLEQIYRNPPVMTPAYVALLKNHPVWDYSARNIAALAEEGIPAALCGVGYMPSLTRIAAAAMRDIDVLFVGSMNHRRQAILEKIGTKVPFVIATFDSYGPERDALIARAKIVLNMHFFESKLFEIVRVSYLLANKACVVSESGEDSELEAPFSGGVTFADYDGLAETCWRLLADDAERQRRAEKGFEQMRALSQVDMLKKALSSI
jgi:hypothetical protein